MSSRYSRDRLPHRAVVEEAQRADAVRDLAVQEHVVVDGQARHEREVLEDGVDAERASVRHRLELHLLAVDEHPAGIGLVEAGQDLDQRRLARAVVADQAEHLAGAEVERDVLERCHDTEALADVLDANRVGSARRGGFDRRRRGSLMSSSRAAPIGGSAPGSR